MQELIFKQECIDDVIHDITTLARDHWDEVESAFFGKRLYVPMEEQYRALENVSMLHIHTIRTTLNTLCAYAIFTLAPCHHRHGQLMAALDALYLSPQVRQGFTAVRFLRSTETALKKRGAIFMQYSSPESRPCGALYKRLGATMTETIWHKEL